MAGESASSPFGPIAICPGPGRNTRNAGTVWGTDPRGAAPGTPNNQQPGPVKPDTQGNRPIWEWQWAQTAMYAYYFADFMLAHDGRGFVLSEAQYAYLLTGIDLADAVLKKLSIDFRRDYAAGGRLRPDIIGFCVGPRAGAYEVTVELLEVSTAGQAGKTLKEDVLYKLKKLTDILKGQELEIAAAFSAPPRLVLNVGPAKWKPQTAWQRVVPLPLRTDPTSNTTYVEWICFQPTFAQNDGHGVDGLLLYEIHTYPIKSPQIPLEVLAKLRDQEKQQRQQQQVAYGLTLTPWLTSRYLDEHTLDRDQLRLLADLSVIGAVALIAVVAAPAIAGISFAAILGEIGLAASAVVSTARMLLAARMMQATMQTAMQWTGAMGAQIVVP